MKVFEPIESRLITASGSYPKTWKIRCLLEKKNGVMRKEASTESSDGI